MTTKPAAPSANRLLVPSATATAKTTSKMNGVKKKKSLPLRIVSNQQNAAADVEEDGEASPVYDSVEWSFREKLKKAEKNHRVRNERCPMQL
jgi:hypothetical protein